MNKQKLSFVLAGVFCLTLLNMEFSVQKVMSQSAKEPFKLGVEEKHRMEETNYPSYPSYPSNPQFSQQVPTASPLPATPPHRGSVTATHPPPLLQHPKTFKTQIANPGVLPVDFLGFWQVAGRRQQVEALPEFSATAHSVFASSTSNTWQINGNPNNGYAFVSDTGVRTQLVVDKVQGNTAYLRYQHPIGNTVAQEAIVMMLSPNGAEFSGLERISIIKQGEPSPRAKVTYQLVGRRQR